MEAHDESPAVSRNVVAEVSGKSKPEEVVIVSGHIDSWDVGQGAMDDGGGAFISWMSLVVLKTLGLRPKRTVRFVNFDDIHTPMDVILKSTEIQGALYPLKIYFMDS